MAPAAEAAEVRRLIAKNNSKSAVELAKQIHKRGGTPATEALLVEAYGARIRSLVEHRMTDEAEALLASIRERFPASMHLLEPIEAAMPVNGARLEDLVRPLAAAGVPPETRAAIERTLRTTLVEPAALARCRSLPADHPLRQAAAALDKAFDAVTGGPVADDALELPEISRRSPLAPWKPLVRAIACFYRGDDAGCEANLAAIDPESAPARLVAPLRATLDGRSRMKLKPAAAALADRLGGDLKPLEAALRAVHDAGEDDDLRSFTDAVRIVVASAREDCPDLLPVLRRHIAVRARLFDFPDGAVNAALGGPARRDAHFFLLLARAMEDEGEDPIDSLMAWEEFRTAAINEGWFPARGAESAVLYLHMAGIAGSVAAADMKAMYGEIRRMFQQMAGGEVPMLDTSLPHLHPGWLYEQACAMDPHPEAFAAWMEWAGHQNDPSVREKVSEAWHAALPHDPRPLLELMQAAEDRRALKKALGYLRQAEVIDGLNPEVRRARLRLLVRGAIKHLEQRKPHLALRELNELDTLPQAREGDRPAFLAGLRWMAARVAGDEAAERSAAAAVRDALGGRASMMALAAISSLCGQPAGVRTETATGPGTWVEAAGRVFLMCRDLGFRTLPPQDWQAQIARELRAGVDISPPMLEAFGEAAALRNWHELAFSASVIGMAMGPEHEARFLLLRGRSLPDWAGERRDDCLAAAIALAHRRHDTELAAKAVDLRRQFTLAAPFGLDSGGAMLNELGLEAVLARERKAKSCPQLRQRWDDDLSLPYGPYRRRRRSKRPSKPRLPAAAQEDLF